MAMKNVKHESNLVGTPFYFAPELLLEKNQFSTIIILL
jgi:hypothetical protein